MYTDPKHVKSPKTPSPRRSDYFKKAIRNSDKSSRCTFVNSDTNKRCKNPLGVYPMYCHLHTGLIHNLQIKTSQIPNAGMGLFAGNEGFTKGDVIFRYGFPYNKVTENTYNRVCDATQDKQCYEYLFCDSNDKSKRKHESEGMDCWESLDIRSTIARYSNSSWRSNFRHNAYFDMIMGSPYIIASRNIAPNKEIFTDYGKGYFEG